MRPAGADLGSSLRRQRRVEFGMAKAFDSDAIGVTGVWLRTRDVDWLARQARAVITTTTRLITVDDRRKVVS
jgi:hypothetical protein